MPSAEAKTTLISMVSQLSAFEESRASHLILTAIGLSRTAIFEAVDQSLARLQTTYIDVLHVHRFDESVPAEETMEALHQLVVSGKVRYLAASSMWTYQFAMLQGIAEQRGWTKFVAMQNHYSLLYREEEREMVKYCNKTGIGLFPVSRLSSRHER